MSRHYLVQLTGADDFYQHTSVLVEVEDKDCYETAIKNAIDEYDAPWVINVIADDVHEDDVNMLVSQSDHYLPLS